MQETVLINTRRFDWLGFLALAVGIGALQLMLDRGEQAGWFESREILVEAIISSAGFYFFFAHSLTTATPFVRFAMFRDRNFVAGCVFMMVIGVVLFATMALVTPYMQNVVGYPDSDRRLSAGGARRRHLGRHADRRPSALQIEARYLVLTGLVARRLHAASNGWFHRSDLVSNHCHGQCPARFRPRARLRAAEHGRLCDSAGHAAHRGDRQCSPLLRNIGSSVGISMVIARLTEGTIEAHARLAEFVTPFNGALNAVDPTSPLDAANDKGRALLDAMVSQQAAIIAYGEDFKFLMFLILAAIPLVLIIGSSRVANAAPSEAVFE